MITVEIKDGRTAPPPSLEEVQAGADPTPTATVEGIYLSGSVNGYIEVEDAIALANELLMAVSKVAPLPTPQEKFDSFVAAKAEPEIVSGDPVTILPEPEEPKKVKK